MSLTAFQKRILEMTKFFLIFSLTAIPIYLINWLNVDFYPLELIETLSSSMLLKVFNIPHYVNESISYETSHTIPLIIAGSEVLGIDRACTAYVPMSAFLGLIIASPKRNKKKALLFLPVIYSFNILRLFCLGIFSVYSPGLIDLLHTVLWREGLVLTVFLLWVKWFKS